MDSTRPKKCSEEEQLRDLIHAHRPVRHGGIRALGGYGLFVLFFTNVWIFFALFVDHFVATFFASCVILVVGVLILPLDYERLNVRGYSIAFSSGSSDRPPRFELLEPGQSNIPSLFLTDPVVAVVPLGGWFARGKLWIHGAASLHWRVHAITPDTLLLHLSDDQEGHLFLSWEWALALIQEHPSGSFHFLLRQAFAVDAALRTAPRGSNLLLPPPPSPDYDVN